MLEDPGRGRAECWTRGAAEAGPGGGPWRAMRKVVGGRAWEHKRLHHTSAELEGMMPQEATFGHDIVFMLGRGSWASCLQGDGQ